MPRKPSPSCISMRLDNIDVLVTYYYSNSPQRWTEANGDPGEQGHTEVQIEEIVNESTGKPIDDLDPFFIQIAEENILDYEQSNND